MGNLCACRHGDPFPESGHVPMEKPIENSEAIASAFQFFEGRISAELERTNIVQELQKMNDELEQLVDERTKKLKNALLSLECHW